jgi:hypothetical protein
MSTTQINVLNDQVRAAQKYDESKPQNIPFWRNFYLLSIKQSRTQVPVVKRVYLEGGFNAAKAFCQMYCDQLGYQFLTLCPEISDLLFELNGDEAFKTQKVEHAEPLMTLSKSNLANGKS